MTQPPYRPSEGNPMRRFALFSVALLILIVIGSLPFKGGQMKHSMCVCLPTRAALILKSVTGGNTKTQASVRAPSTSSITN
jgi:hypothetical protein